MNEAKRNQMLADVSAIVAKDRPRLPITAVGSAWAMQKDKVTISPRVDEDTLAMDIKPAKK
jgi:peptide/nickel transport system substrate-binding protein